MNFTLSNVGPIGWVFNLFVLLIGGLIGAIVGLISSFPISIVAVPIVGIVRHVRKRKTRQTAAPTEVGGDDDW
ncbi:hypothetical protein [Streptomyces sp. NPDC046727]|uniref:hypothetical protein n=1 Tax=Streptomyces sp. NPDC046727 TaxID=3155373 RepID=UPI0033E94DB2